MVQIPPIDNSLLYQGDPGNPPFVFNVQGIDGRISQFATGAIFETLKAIANNSMGTQALFWACQQGQFVGSKLFCQMVSMLGDTTDMEMARNPQLNPPNFMMNFARQVVEWKAAELVANDQRFGYSMNDPTVRQRIQGLLQQQANHIQELGRYGQWKQQQFQQQPQYGNGGFNGGGGWGGGGFGNNRGNGGGYAAGPVYGNGPQPGGREISTGMLAGGGNSFSDYRNDNRYSDPVPAAEPYQAPPQQTQQQQQPVQQTTTYTGSDSYISHKELVDRGGRSDSSGVNCGMVISLSKNRFVYKLQPDGNYLSNLIDDKASNMKAYEHHETNHLFQPRSKKIDGAVHTDPQLVQKTFDEARNFKTVDELLVILGADNTLDNDITKTPITVDLTNTILQTEIGATMPQVIRELRRNYPDLHSKLNRDNSVLVNVQYVDPETITGRAAVEFESFVNAKDFHLAVDRFARLYDLIPNRIWKWLHDEITHAVNELIYLRFDSGFRVGSFVDDHVDLVEGLTKKATMGPEVAKAYVESFQTIIKRFNVKLDADDVETIIEPLTEEEKENGLVRVINYTDLMLYVPIDSTAFDFGAERRFGMVTQDLTPELFDICQRMLESSTSSTRRVRIVTKDAEELIVLRGFFNPNNIMIANVQTLTVRK